MAPVFASILAQAADAAEAGAVPPSVQVESVWDFVQKGGLMMIPIGLCSLVAVTVIVERFISLRRANVIPAAFLPGLRKVLKAKPGDKDTAIAFCRKSKSPVASVFAAGLKKLNGSPELMERHIQEAGEREVVKLRKNVRSLSVIASVSPLMGLLGTIFGMITAFQTVAVSGEALGKTEMSGEALGKTEMLAEGIYQAMITTAAGLAVAIPVLICYHWISAKIDKLVSDIDYMTVEFMDEVADGTLGAAVVEPKPQAAVAAEAAGENAAADVPAASASLGTT
jgi:biopolymer transport protein ExbB